MKSLRGCLSVTTLSSHPKDPQSLRWGKELRIWLSRRILAQQSKGRKRKNGVWGRGGVGSGGHSHRIIGGLVAWCWDIGHFESLADSLSREKRCVGSDG